MANVDLPSADELDRIPRWASVAYAARCARRVLPLLKKGGVAPEIVTRLTAAVSAAEDAARLSSGANPSDTKPMMDAALLATKSLDQRSTSHSAGMAAAFACIAAHNASLATGLEKGRAPRHTELVEQAAESAVAAAGGKGTPEAVYASLMDYDALKALAMLERWPYDATVDVELVGPLWWGREPSWWPEATLALSNKPPALHFEFAIPPGVSKEEADRVIGEILQRANELHHSMGGTGLTITDTQVFESEPAMVPAGGDDDGEGR